jgi:DEAD/DEAH box helicase domain-containing protein
MLTLLVLSAAAPCRPLFGERQLQAALQQLTASSLLGRHPRDPPSWDALHYIGRTANPAAEVSLRTIDPERFVIYNAADACVLEEIEANMAFYEIYDGAIYMYQVRLSCSAQH